MAQTLHGARHPRYRGATVPPHHQAGLRWTPDAADLGAKEAVQSGSACRSGREIWARASVHARRSNHKAHTETWLLVAQQLLVLYCQGILNTDGHTFWDLFSVFWNPVNFRWAWRQLLYFPHCMWSFRHDKFGIRYWSVKPPILFRTTFPEWFTFCFLCLSLHHSVKLFKLLQ